MPVLCFRATIRQSVLGHNGCQCGEDCDAFQGPPMIATSWKNSGCTDEYTGGTPQAKTNRQGHKSWKLDIHGECPNI